MSKTFLLTATLFFSFASMLTADFDFDFKSSHYRVVTSNQDWSDAAATANSLRFNGVSGSLARIDSDAENLAIIAALLANLSPADVASTVAPDGGGGAYLWLGGTDRITESTWLWDGNGDGRGVQFWVGDENGSSVDGLYNNFGTASSQNEPDNFGAGQDALGISLNGWPLGSVGQWNDVNESNNLYFLVEFEKANPKCILADVNGDGAVDLLDVGPFVAALSSGDYSCEADTNQDGIVNLLDVASFVALISG